MHSGFERPRALHGVNAHQARVSSPEPSHAFFAAGDDRVAALAVCTLGRAVRWRSRGAARAACDAAVARCPEADAASAVTADPARDACRASAFSQSATGSVPGECIDPSSGDGPCSRAVASDVAGVVADGSTGAGAGVAASVDGAVTFVDASAAPAFDAASPEGGEEGRSRDHAPQPSATMPVNASAAAALR